MLHVNIEGNFNYIYILDNYLAVDCKSVQPGEHWRGIHIHDTSPNSSVLQHVIIDGAGVNSHNDTHHESVPSLFVSASQIQIGSVQIIIF